MGSNYLYTAPVDEYINRKDALKIFSTSKENWKDYEASACIAALPAADVVEVVRCKYCKHWKEYSYCTKHETEPFEDYFCADGKRKESI